MYLAAAMHVLLCNFRSFISQLKKLQAMVGVSSGASGIIHRVTARQVQTGTCIMVSWYIDNAHVCLTYTLTLSVEHKESKVKKANLYSALHISLPVKRSDMARM